MSTTGFHAGAPECNNNRINFQSLQIPCIQEVRAWFQAIINLKIVFMHFFHNSSPPRSIIAFIEYQY
eukprot:2697475-Karenia_brevis.AAC.1